MSNLDNGGERYVFGASVIEQREKSFHLLLDNGDEMWFPRSQTDWEGDGQWSIPHWLAEEKGLE